MGGTHLPLRISMGASHLATSGPFGGTQPLPLRHCMGGSHFVTSGPLFLPGFSSLARGHEPWRASLRLGRLVALLRAANGLVQEYGTNADADANADTAASTTPASATAMMMPTAHLAGERRAWTGGADDQQQPQGRSN